MLRTTACNRWRLNSLLLFLPLPPFQIDPRELPKNRRHENTQLGKSCNLSNFVAQVFSLDLEFALSPKHMELSSYMNPIWSALIWDICYLHRLGTSSFSKGNSWWIHTPDVPSFENTRMCPKILCEPEEQEMASYKPNESIYEKKWKMVGNLLGRSVEKEKHLIST